MLIVETMKTKAFRKIFGTFAVLAFAVGVGAAIRSVSAGYSSHYPGQIFAMFNSLGLLELGVYQGNIAALENINTATEIKIRFDN